MRCNLVKLTAKEAHQMTDDHSPSNAEEKVNSGQLAKKAAEGGSIVLAGSVIGKVTNLSLQIILVRILKAKDYGLYSLGFTIFTFEWC